VNDTIGGKKMLEKLDAGDSGKFECGVVKNLNENVVDGDEQLLLECLFNSKIQTMFLLLGQKGMVYLCDDRSDGIGGMHRLVARVDGGNEDHVASGPDEFGGGLDEDQVFSKAPPLQLDGMGMVLVLSSAWSFCRESLVGSPTTGVSVGCGKMTVGNGSDIAKEWKWLRQPNKGDGVSWKRWR
jgi:hypothetical protein